MLAMQQDVMVTIKSRRVLIGLLTAWAVLLWLSFPRPDFWVLAHVAYLPLALAAVRTESTKRLIGYSYLAGWVWWLIGVIWLANVTAGGYVAVCFYLALFTVLFVMLVRWIDRWWSLPYVIVVPLAVVTCEWLRAWMLTGFPWFNLGQSQPIVLIQIADFAGGLGVSLLPAMTSGLLLDLLLRPLGRARGGRFRLGGRFFVSTFIWGATFGLAIGYGMLRVAEFHNIKDDAARLRVAVVQSDVPQAVKDTEAAAATDAITQRRIERRMFNQLVDLTTAAAEQNADLIAWPETIVPRPLNEETLEVARLSRRMLMEVEGDDPNLGFYEYWTMAAGYYERIEQLLEQTGVAMIVGAHAYYNQLEPDKPVQRYNSAFFLTPEKPLAGRFDKIHRVPFGEYVPFRESMPWVYNLLLALTPYDRDYSLERGERYLRFALTVGEGEQQTTWQIGTPICFEDVISYVPRKMMYTGTGRKAGDLLVNLTNDGWYPGSAQGWQHEQIARFRCVELRVPMARAVNRGVSGFIDSIGRVTKRVVVEGEHQMVAGFAVEELVRDPRRTVFGRWGNLVAQASAATVGLLVVIGWLLGRKKETWNEQSK